MNPRRRWRRIVHAGPVSSGYGAISRLKRAWCRLTAVQGVYGPNLTQDNREPEPVLPSPAHIPDFPLAAGDGHALADAHADEVGLELGEGGEDVAEHLAHGIVRVVEGPAEGRFHAAFLRLVGDGAGIRDSVSGASPRPEQAGLPPLLPSFVVAGVVAGADSFQVFGGVGQHPAGVALGHAPQLGGIGAGVLAFQNGVERERSRARTELSTESPGLPGISLAEAPVQQPAGTAEQRDPPAHPTGRRLGV